MALNSQGSSILHDSGNSPHAYAAIEAVKSITGPQGTANLIDVSNLASTAKEYLAGLSDSGQITLACLFTGGNEQMDLRRMFINTADAEAFMIKIPTSSAKTTFHTFGFNAVVLKWDLTESVDAAVLLNVTLQVTGVPNYAIV
jgi:hypothetical protein